MIQRIQTLYLFLAFALMGLMYFFPLMTFAGNGQEYEIVLLGIRSTSAPNAYIASALHLLILWVTATVLPLMNIFLYKARLLQMRLCLVEILLALGLQIVVGIYVFNAKSMAEQCESHAITYSVASLIPLACIILSALAFRAIRRDQRLVRSLDRIR